MTIDLDVVNASLRVLGLGMAGILATTAVFILLTFVLRRAFPAKSGDDATK